MVGGVAGGRADGDLDARAVQLTAALGLLELVGTVTTDAEQPDLARLGALALLLALEVPAADVADVQLAVVFLRAGPRLRVALRLRLVGVGIPAVLALDVDGGDVAGLDGAARVAAADHPGAAHDEHGQHVLGLRLAVASHRSLVGAVHVGRRLLLVDEAWMLMQYEDSANFLFSLAKRARKYYLGLTTISQDVEDFMSSKMGRAIVSNSSMQLLLKQSPSAVDVLAEVFKLTSEERKRLSNFPVGHGLFFAGQNHVHIQIIASETEESLITTNPNDKRNAQR